MTPFMAAEGVSSCEGFPADFTDETLFPGVHRRVDLQVHPRQKTFAANFTHKRLFSSVDPHVGSQVGLADKELAAH